MNGITLGAPSSVVDHFLLRGFVVGGPNDGVGGVWVTGTGVCGWWKASSTLPLSPRTTSVVGGRPSTVGTGYEGVPWG